MFELKPGKLFTPKDVIILNVYKNKQGMRSFYVFNYIPLLLLSSKPHKIIGSQNKWFIKFLYKDQITWWIRNSCDCHQFMKHVNQNFKLLEK